MPPRLRYSQRMRSESHTSSDQDQYQDAAEYLDLEVSALSLSASLPNMDIIPDTSSSAPGELLEETVDEENGSIDNEGKDISDDHVDHSHDDSNLDAGPSHTQCHEYPSSSDEAAADNAGSGSSGEA